MASDYIMDKELPVLISRYKAQQLDLFPLYLSPCTWHIVRIPYPDPGNNSKKAYFLLSGLSCPDHDPKNPLDRESDSKVNEVFSRITQRLLTYHEERKKKMQVGQKSGDKEQERAKLVGVIKRENKSINNKNQPEEKSVHKENRIFQSTTIVPEEQTSKNATIVSDNLQNESTTIVHTDTTLKEPLPIEAATFAVKINGPNKFTPTKTTTIVPEKPAWASSAGSDDYGHYADFTLKGITQRMRWIEPGEFLMGSPPDEPERRENEHRHRVVLSQGFWLADTTCTRRLWQEVMGESPSFFKGKNRPVTNVSWEMAQGFIKECNILCRDLSLRLPTEAEWEFACRAGTTTPFFFGPAITTDQVNYNGNYPYKDGKRGLYRETTVDVKSLPCNTLGLFQMHGNVWEWCSDWYNEDYYKHSPVNDPPGPENGDDYVLRGGSWKKYAWYSRSAYRVKSKPNKLSESAGFRLARDH